VLTIGVVWAYDRSMGARGALLIGALMAVLVAGCGSSSHKTSTSTGTSTSTSAAASGMSGHLLSNGELAGFTGASPKVASSVAGWVSDNGAPPTGAATEQARLTKLGFVRGAREDLTGGSSGNIAGLSLVEQFRTPKEAQSEVTFEVDQFKSSNAASAKTFAVPGIPGALGFAELGNGGGGINVAFAKGTYAYVVGQVLPSAATYGARVTKLVAAAQGLYRRASS
jgi:hypothetical protein